MNKDQLKTVMILIGILGLLFFVTFIIMIFNTSIWIRISSLFPFTGTLFLVYIEGWFSQDLYFKIKKEKKNGKWQ